MTHPKAILLASSSFDRHTTTPVVQELHKRGYKTILYEADRVASGETSLVMRMDSAGLHIVYDDSVIHNDTIAAAWYRRPNIFGPLQPDKAKQQSIDRERRELQDTLWSVIADSTWLSCPDKLHAAANKLRQLELAQSLGFSIPTTIISNQWQPISQTLPVGDTVLKMPFGLLYDHDEPKLFYTKVLQNHGKQAITPGLPFPGIWQPYISKVREWRVTVVGNSTFNAAIYTSDKPKDDWRKYQGSANITFRNEHFPAQMAERCVRFTKQLGLKYGAFDFIESADGTITFLECNPNGQYSWIERALNLPISAAIADELSIIANE